MIELIACEQDDLGFLALAEGIVNGALATLQVREVYLVHVANWFDHKWLGWRSRGGEELRVPTFDPNRVRTEKHFIWDANRARWASVNQSRPLHVSQPGRPWLAEPLDRFSSTGAFVWYSGNTVNNRAGSLMFYLSGAEGYAWYASFQKRENWRIDGECQITKRELLAFEDRGRRMRTD